MNIKNIAMYGLVALGISTHATEPAERMTPKEASKRIEAAANVFSEIAESGMTEYVVTPTKSVRAALLELALAQGMIDSKADFSWKGKSNEAWEADSTNWGETTMKDAYSYITEIDPDRERSLDDAGDTAGKAKLLGQIEDAKAAFKTLLHTGVQFGVVPMGAVQCGVTFAALAILDPYTGKIYTIAKEGSGC